MLSVTMLIVPMLSVTMLSVAVLSVAVPLALLSNIRLSLKVLVCVEDKSFVTLSKDFISSS